ncbi:MAG TPA: MFS transporter, partial [Paraburkholderia sp.]|nr:MFS transporter [Paraburkholderia sp.]
MANIAMPTDDNLAHRKSVQEHIDELPMWADGATLPSAPMTGMQWLIWALAAAGKFFEGYVVFMTGVALPLFEREFDIAPFQHGVIGAASLFGILVGAIALGGLSDRFGRKPMFVVEMIIFVAFLAALCFASSYIQVVIFLFGLGLALGCDYPTAHMIISENIPSSARGKLVLGAFAFQAVGALAGVAVGFFVLSVLPQLNAWRWMYASAIIPAVLAGPFLHRRERQLAVDPRLAIRRNAPMPCLMRPMTVVHLCAPVAFGLLMIVAAPIVRVSAAQVT